MKKKILINASDPEELRVALVENGVLDFFYCESAAFRQRRANIYKGVVKNVEPSLQAAFVDYGRPRHGFLQISDISPDLMPESWEPGKDMPSIAKVLKKGQGVLVQLVKEETGNKGAALTNNLSLPGQCLVLTVGRKSFGVSRKIEKDSERNRLKKILGGLNLADGLGIIARTAAEGRSKKDLVAEVKLLQRMWNDISARSVKAAAPSLLHREEDLALRTVRDFFTSDVTEILVDDPEVHERLTRFVSLMNPRRKKAVKLYREARPIFGKYEIEKQLESVYLQTVQLPSGGSIVIQSTEALVSIDVNSGKAVKGKELEETALNVNLEAAGEIARQLRLRDLGGLVVIDFIDMRERKHQRALQKKLKEELKRDKAKTTVGLVSRFGLVEMSRQRIRPPVDFGATRVCPHCMGRGVLRSVESTARTALRSLEKRLREAPGQSLRVLSPPDTAHYLVNQKRAELTQLEAAGGVCLEIAADGRLAGDQVLFEKLDQCWVKPEPAANQAMNTEQGGETKADGEASEEAPKAQPKKRSRRRRSGSARRRARAAKQAAAEAAKAP